MGDLINIGVPTAIFSLIVAMLLNNLRLLFRHNLALHGINAGIVGACRKYRFAIQNLEETTLERAFRIELNCWGAGEFSSEEANSPSEPVLKVYCGPNVDSILCPEPIYDSRNRLTQWKLDAPHGIQGFDTWIIECFTERSIHSVEVRLYGLKSSEVREKALNTDLPRELSLTIRDGVGSLSGSPSKLLMVIFTLLPVFAYITLLTISINFNAIHTITVTDIVFMVIIAFIASIAFAVSRKPRIAPIQAFHRHRNFRAPPS